MSAVQYEAFRSLAEDHRPAPQSRYDHVLHAFLDDLFAAYPTWATEIGHHERDHRWPDLTDEGRDAGIRMLAHHRSAVEALSADELSPDEVIDRAILLEAIDGIVFGETTLREGAWDPLMYVRVMGDGLFALLAREYAPFAHRGRAFLIRMRHLPDIVAAARESLVGLPDRPVSLLHTETALSQLSGINDLIEEAVAEADRRRAAGEDTDLHAELVAAVPDAVAALDAFRAFLEDEVKPRAEGEGRLGPESFQAKLRHTLASDLPYEELAARARRDYDVVRAEIVRLARELWPVWIRDEPLPAGRDGGEDPDEVIVRRVLDAVSREHRQPDELLDHCQAEVETIQRFVSDRALVGLPEEPLRITWTPVFMRAYGGAFLHSPGPLDKGQASYFWITPPGEDWPHERVESYLREDNDRMLRLLCIHEGVPGHYLQLAWANRSLSLTRSIFSSGMFAEGWAVYVTQVMMDIGYGSDDPALMLIHWKFYLRAITNAIIDVAIHTGGMTEDEALDLMVRGGFQEDQEARAKWLRARLTSTQLSTYYLGSLEMWDMEVAARHRAAVAAGRAETDVPQQRVVGGLGDTPGFDYRAHLESVISHGMPPIKWVRSIVLSGEPVPA